MSGVAARANPLLAGEPYKDILDDPNFRPKPEVVPNKTIDQLITDAYGGLPSKTPLPSLVLGPCFRVGRVRSLCLHLYFIHAFVWAE